MPILWKHILSQYFKVLLLSITTFIAVLVTTRLDEIAHFATLGSESRYIFLFILYQIPYVLPIALPISALISALILVQGMSNSHELTAMRACGLAVREIFTPIILAASLLAVVSFYFVSEMATSSHLYTSLLKNELRSINPLLMLTNKHLMKLKGMHFDTLGASRLGESASSVIVAIPNKRNGRLDLVLAGKMSANATHFIAEDVTLISNIPAQDENSTDLIALENIKNANTSVNDFAQLIQKKVWNLNDDHLNLALLLVRLNDHWMTLEKAKEENKPASEIKTLQRAVNRNISEIIRRISLALAVLTFTVMGASFGVTISRLKSNRGLLYVVLLTGLFLTAYFSATGISHLLIASTLLYLVPHGLIILASIWVVYRASRGVE